MFEKLRVKLLGSFSSKAADARTVHRIAGAEEERKFLEGQFCECGGTWIAQTMTVTETRDELQQFTRLVQCSVCGTQTQFEFVAPVAALEDGADGLDSPSPREQHYAFAHNSLHRHFFTDPEGLIGFLRTPPGQQRAREVWEKLGAGVSDPSGIVDARELQVLPHMFDGRLGVLVRMPSPIASPEAYFIALIACVPSVDAARYFVLELTSFDEVGQPQAVLCEWLEGVRRRNHERVVSPSEAEFCSVVDDQLGEERNRRNAGAQPVVARTWDIAAETDPTSVIGQGGAYRLHPCAFAFHVLPDALAGGDEWFRSSDVQTVQSRVDAVWDTAAVICRANNVVSMATRPNVDRVEVAGAWRYLIRMPPSLSPPEPELILLPNGLDRKIFLLELADHRRRIGILASITTDGTHALLHELDAFEEQAYVHAIEDLIRAQPHSHKEFAKTMEHVLLYAEISNACKKSGGADQPLEKGV